MPCFDRRQELAQVVNPSHRFNYEIIREFYSNALPIEGMRYLFTIFLREKEVSFTRHEINDYLDNPLTL